MEKEVLDIGSQTAADLAHIHDLCAKADEFYRYYREALLNLGCNREKPRPTEWIPISNH